MAIRKEITTDIPGRLDRLPWTMWHTKVVFALGFAWLLDSLEASIIGSVVGILKGLWKFSAFEGSLVVSVWLVGIMVGALAFGYLTDRYGRRTMFVLTLLWYALFTVAAAFSTGFWMFISLRFLAAVGVGGEYAAISAAVVEFVPKRMRGRIDAFIMSTWPIGALASALVVVVALGMFPADLAWRFGFIIAVGLAAFALYIRWAVPESPRWLLDKRRFDDAEKVVDGVEEYVRRNKPGFEFPGPQLITFTPKERDTWQLTKELMSKYPWRLLLGASMDFAQVAVGYGALAYAPLVLFPSVGIKPATIPLYFAIGNFVAFLGGLTSMAMVDNIGRRPTGFIAYASVPIAAMTLFLAHGTTPILALASFCFVMYSYTWAWVTEYVIKSEIFPTRMRATGIGWATFFGRTGGVIAAPMMTGIYQATGSPFMAALSLALITTPGWVSGLGWAIRGIEGKKRALEAMGKDMV